MTRRTIRIALMLAFVTMAACSQPSSEPGPLALPETITFDREPMNKAASWNRRGITGVAYVKTGEKLPAPLQVGVIVSNDHPNATLLHVWTRSQFYGSGASAWYEDNRNEESCTVGVEANRPFIALEVCKTGVARAACVESDEQLDVEVIERCGPGGSACNDVCDRRWLERREALDLLAADMLTFR
jgi:hypothetical protein